MGVAVRRLGPVWLGVLALGLAVLAPSASAVVVHQPDGQSVGVMPRPGPSAALTPGLRAAAISPELSPSADPSLGDLDFHGGIVLHATRPYLIFWDPNDAIANGTEDVFRAYLTNTSDAGLTNTDVYAVGRQYTDTTGFADDRQTFDSATQALVDPQPFPSSDSSSCPNGGASACVTDTQLQAELTRLIAAKGLPVGDGPDAPVYFMVTPVDVNVCVSGSECADNRFCAFHSNFEDAMAGSHEVIYASIPLLDANKTCQEDNTAGVQAPNGRQADGTWPDVAVDNMSHEYNESITDPLFSGWFSDASGNEEADNCEAWGPTDDPLDALNPHAYVPALGGSEADGDLFDQSIGRGQFYTQSEWSNGQADCFLAETGAPPVPSFAASDTGGTTVSFNPSASATANGFSSTTWHFGDGTTSFATGGPGTISHTYAAPGPEQVILTLVDSTGSLASETETIDVSPTAAVVGPPPTPPVAGNPTAVFTSSPKHPASGLRVHFDASRSTGTGAAIATYAWKFGDGQIGSGVRPAHTYRHAGRYTVTLTVTDGSGRSSSSAKGLRVVTPGRISKLGLKRAGTGVRLRVKLSGPGTLLVGSHRHRVTRARTLTIGLGLSRAAHRALDQSHRFVYTVTLVFRPQAGTTVHKTARLKL
jgi:PKD repeat protein